ncbi:MAG: CPBP family intramembrane glutamic endopeptidase [Phycisphaerales bacterium]
MIDGIAVLLQSPAPAGDAAGGMTPLEQAAVGFVVLVVLALLFPPSSELLRGLFLPPREPAGRLPRDPVLGALSMLGYIVIGAVGATIGASVVSAAGIGDEAWARLVRGVSANALQLGAVVLIIASPLFIDAPRRAMRAGPAAVAGILSLLLAAPVVLASALVVQALLTFLGHPPAPEVSHETLAILRAKDDALFTALTLAQVAVLVPFAEEAAWRGLMQPAMRRAGLPALASAVATAVLFALVHWSVLSPDGRITGLTMLFLLGTALGLLREHTGGILAPAVAHGLFNAANVGLAMS